MGYLESNYRKKFRRLYQKYRMIIILTRATSLEDREYIDRHFSNINKLTKKEIQRLTPELEEKLAYLVGYYGWRGDQEFIDDLVEKENEGIQKLLYIPKYDLDSVFTNYGKSVNQYELLPPHTRIGIDLHRIYETLELILLEAMLFEDVAIQWNNYLKLIHEDSQDKVNIKFRNSLNRSICKSVFNLIEGYINGIAFDTLYKNDHIEDNDIAILSEYDSVREKNKFVSLRDKILKYPKIALKLDHPLFQENNSDELKMLLIYEQKVRHSLIHPTPKCLFSDDDDENFIIKEQYYLSPLDHIQLGELCDNVVKLISKIDESLDGLYGSVSWWLKRRNSDGFFPNDAFN